MIASFALVAVPSSAAAAFKARSVPFQKGMTLVDWGDGGYPARGVDAQLRKMKSNRVKSVTLIQTWVQDSTTSLVVKPGRQTVPERNLIAAIRSARKLGISVVLRPYVDVKGGKWRGRISPRSRSRWFASYTAFALRYARIAKRERVRLFIFASEMVDLSLAAPREWSALAAKVRATFPGPVGYEANWGEVSKATWLGSLDFVGVSGYFPLCKRPTNNVASLVNSWKTRFLGKIGEASRRIGRPLMFSEIGYRPIRSACVQPWNTSWLQRKDTLAQNTLYEAALRVWWGAPSWFRGMHWWAISPRGVRKAPENHDPLAGAWGRIKSWYGKRAAGE